MMMVRMVDVVVVAIVPVIGHRVSDGRAANAADDRAHRAADRGAHGAALPTAPPTVPLSSAKAN